MSADRAPAKTVLVADDDADLRSTLAEYFALHGFEVLEASNGLEALLHVKRRRPGVIVLDLAMPRLGGLEALKRIAAFDPAAAVIVVSGAVDEQTRRAALALGARAVMDKPIALPALLEVLRGAPAPVPATATEAPAAPAAARAPAPDKGADVLVVDDDAGVRAVLEEFLTLRGHTVRSEADGAAALRAIASRIPAVILLDIEMPGLHGVDALPAIRALAPATAVIMISGVADTELAKLALARGAFDYIVKPPDLAYLAQSLQAAITVNDLES
jgi:DNA-binding NtrC family response regulator